MKLTGNTFREVEAAVANSAFAALLSSFVSNAEAFYPGCVCAASRRSGRKLARSFVFAFRDIHANQFR
jgi:hypothetical protein